MEFTKILKPYSALFDSKPLTEKTHQPITIIILSPHPDDESITSSLALRLMHENHARIINIAVTTGSKKDRRGERLKELKDACEFLDFECLHLNENWKTKEKELKNLIQKFRPDLIMAPHTKDFHPTHIKTGELLKKVIAGLKQETFLIAWSEFWGQMSKPNLLIEVPSKIVELQMQALTKHIGEINRNPYHLRLPAWMMDNVRRGSEIIGGTGANASNMAFGVLYRLQLFQKGKISNIKKLESLLTSESDIGQMFKLILDAASGSKTSVK